MDMCPSRKFWRRAHHNHRNSQAPHIFSSSPESGGSGSGSTPLSKIGRESTVNDHPAHYQQPRQNPTTNGESSTSPSRPRSLYLNSNNQNIHHHNHQQQYHHHDETSTSPAPCDTTQSIPPVNGPSSSSDLHPSGLTSMTFGSQDTTGSSSLGAAAVAGRCALVDLSAASTTTSPECWICYDNDRTDMGPIIQPCACSGDVSSVHHDCLKRWLIESYASSENIKCRVCRQTYQLEQGAVWLPSGITLASWFQTAAIMSVMSCAVIGAFFIVRTFEHFYIHTISVGLVIVVWYVCLRMLGFNIITAYHRAKFSAVKIIAPKISDHVHCERDEGGGGGGGSGSSRTRHLNSSASSSDMVDQRPHGRQKSSRSNTVVQTVSEGVTIFEDIRGHRPSKSEHDLIHNDTNNCTNNTIINNNNTNHANNRPTRQSIWARGTGLVRSISVELHHHHHNHHHHGQQKENREKIYRVDRNPNVSSRELHMKRTGCSTGGGGGGGRTATAYYSSHLAAQLPPPSKISQNKSCDQFVSLMSVQLPSTSSSSSSSSSSVSSTPSLEDVSCLDMNISPARR